MYEEAEAILTKPPKHVQEDADPVTESWSLPYPPPRLSFLPPSV